VKTLPPSNEECEKKTTTLCNGKTAFDQHHMLAFDRIIMLAFDQHEACTLTIKNFFRLVLDKQFFQHNSF